MGAELQCGLAGTKSGREGLFRLLPDLLASLFPQGTILAAVVTGVLPVSLP